MSRRFKVTSAIALVTTCLASAAFASSHREAPGITKMPKVDNTDVYAFQSYEPGRAGFTTLIANFQPGENPGDGPNYYTMDPDAIYEISVDNAGDAKEHLTFQFKFSNALKSIPAKTSLSEARLCRSLCGILGLSRRRTTRTWARTKTTL